MNYLFWYKILVFTKPGGDLVEHKLWKDLRFDIRMKYNWYFKYRAALLRVKYPKFYIDQRWGKEEINEMSPKQQIEYRDKRRKIAVKRKITRFRNAITVYETEEKLKLIPDFNNPKYLRTIEKLKEYENELLQLEKISG